MKDVPAVCAAGVPVFPVVVPGAAVSPGTSIWSFENEPAFTDIDGLVLAVFVPSLASVAVNVHEPTVLNVTLRLAVPAAKAVLEGNIGLGAVLVMATLSVELTTFQLASTALTVTLKDVPAVCAAGVPVFPVAVPGAAVSPGTSIWSFENEPAFTVKGLLVPEAREPDPPVFVAVILTPVSALV